MGVRCRLQGHKNLIHKEGDMATYLVQSSLTQSMQPVHVKEFVKKEKKKEKKKTTYLLLLKNQDAIRHRSLVP